MRVKDVPLEEFIQAWVDSDCVAQVRTALGCTDPSSTISARATYLRKNGVALKRMGSDGPNFTRLRKLHADLVKQRMKEEREVAEAIKREAVQALDRKPPIQRCASNLRPTRTGFDKDKFAIGLRSLRFSLTNEHGKRESQADFGARFGKCQKTIWNWERGVSTPRATEIEFIAQTIADNFGVEKAYEITGRVAIVDTEAVETSDAHREVVKAYLLKARPTRLFRISEMIEDAYTKDVPLDPHKDYKQYASLLIDLGCTRENGGKPCSRYGIKARWWKSPYKQKILFRFPMTDKF